MGVGVGAFISFSGRKLKIILILPHLDMTWILMHVKESRIFKAWIVCETRFL